MLLCRRKLKEQSLIIDALRDDFESFASPRKSRTQPTEFDRERSLSLEGSHKQEIGFRSSPCLMPDFQSAENGRNDT
eukprot:224472-Hanusia_phi.AAC.3